MTTHNNSENCCDDSTSEIKGGFKDLEDRKCDTRVIMCIFCCKNIISQVDARQNEGDHDQQGKGGLIVEKDVPRRFFTLLKRQYSRGECNLKDESALDILSQETSLFSEKLKSCEDCTTIIKTYCDLYHEWKCVELRVHWQIEKLWQVMKFTDRVPSRVKTFRTWCLEEDMRSTSLDSVERKLDTLCKFRTDFKRKCKRIKSLPFPRLHLRHVCQQKFETGVSVSPNVSLKKRRKLDCTAPTMATISLDTQAQENQNTERLFLGWISSLTAVICLFNFHLQNYKDKLSPAEPLDQADTQLSYLEEERVPIDEPDVDMEDDNMTSFNPCSDESSHSDVSVTGEAEEIVDGDGNIKNRTVLNLLVENKTKFETINPSNTLLTELGSSVNRKESRSISGVPDHHHERVMNRATEKSFSDGNKDSHVHAQQVSSPTQPVNTEEQIQEEDVDVKEEEDQDVDMASVNSYSEESSHSDTSITEETEVGGVPDDQHEEVMHKTDKSVSDVNIETKYNHNQADQVVIKREKCTLSPKPCKKPDDAGISRNVPRNKILPRRSLRQKFCCLLCKATFSSAGRLEQHTIVCQQQKSSEENISNLVDEQNNLDELDSSHKVVGIRIEHHRKNVIENDKLGETEWNAKDFKDVTENSESSDVESEDHDRDRGIYKCTNCVPHKKFETQNQIKVHKKYLHTNGRYHLCKRDTNVLKNVSMKDINLLNFPSDSKHHPCTDGTCEKVFALPQELERHRKINHNNPRLSCHFCDITAISFSAMELIDHELEHSDDRQENENCDFKRGEKLACDRCGGLYAVKLDFVNHFLETHLELPPLRATCPICNETFNGYEQVPLNHYINYHDLNRLEDPNKIFRCSSFECPAYYLREDQLHVHCKTTHKISGSKRQEQQRLWRQKRKLGPKPHQCPHCSKAFKVPVQLKDHLRINHLGEEASQKKYPKEQCSLKDRVVSFPEDGVTTDDIISERNAKHKCSVDDCYSRFEDEADLINHSKLHGEFKCTFCDVVKTFAPDLAVHETIHAAMSNSNSRKKKFSCARCSFSSIRRWDFVGHHVETHLGLIVDKKRCPICKMAYRYDSFVVEFKNGLVWKHYFDFHKLTESVGDNHQSENVFKCDHEGCKAYFLKSSQAQLHKLEVHENIICPNEERFKCADCGKRFSSTRYLRLHRITMHKLRTEDLPFVCIVPACAKRFENDEDLKNHVKTTHFGKAEQVQHECPFENCDKKYWFKSRLEIHIQTTHRDNPSKGEPSKSKNEQPYVCDECGKSFNDKHKFNQHKKSHAGPETWEFSCSICQKKIFSKHKLEEHMRVHTKDKPFVCQVCGVAYAHRHNLRIHVNNKHGLQDIAKKMNRVHKESARKGKKYK